MSHPSAEAQSFGFWRPSNPATSDSDPRLAFMLAHQGTNRLRFELRSLEEAVASAKDPSLTRFETEMAITKTEALNGRIRPFTSFIDQAVRFEAQEIVAALEEIRQALGSIAERMEPGRPRGAAEIAARLMSRRA